ncbi:MAG: hypothetical protein Q9159_007373 [Coniocarpon cinnabarinum]
MDRAADLGLAPTPTVPAASASVKGVKPVPVEEATSSAHSTNTRHSDISSEDTVAPFADPVSMDSTNPLKNSRPIFPSSDPGHNPVISSFTSTSVTDALDTSDTSGSTKTTLMHNFVGVIASAIASGFGLTANAVSPALNATSPPNAVAVPATEAGDIAHSTEIPESVLSTFDSSSAFRSDQASQSIAYTDIAAFTTDQSSHNMSARTSRATASADQKIAGASKTAAENLIDASLASPTSHTTKPLDIEASEGMAAQGDTALRISSSQSESAVALKAITSLTVISTNEASVVYTSKIAVSTAVTGGGNRTQASKVDTSSDLVISMGQPSKATARPNGSGSMTHSLSLQLWEGLMMVFYGVLQSL